MLEVICLQVSYFIEEGTWARELKRLCPRPEFGGGTLGLGARSVCPPFRAHMLLIVCCSKCNAEHSLKTCPAKEKSPKFLLVSHQTEHEYS